VDLEHYVTRHFEVGRFNMGIDWGFDWGFNLEDRVARKVTRRISAEQFGGAISNVTAV
jgi:hypothetical protein